MVLLTAESLTLRAYDGRDGRHLYCDNCLLAERRCTLLHAAVGIWVDPTLFRPEISGESSVTWERPINLRQFL